MTFDDVMSGEKAPLGRILRNFRLHMRALFQGKHPFWVTSHPIAMSVMRNGIFCTATIVRKKRGNRLRMRTRSLQSGPLPVMSFTVNAASGHMTSGDVTSGISPLCSPEIRLEPSRYTIHPFSIFIFVRSRVFQRIFFIVFFFFSLLFTAVFFSRL